MRKQIAQESIEPYIDGRYWLPGCFKWEDDRIPVANTASVIDVQSLIGYATDFRREDDGKITAEIVTDKDIEDFSFTVYVTNIEAEGDMDLWKAGRISSCRIREVFMSEQIPWSKTWAEQKMVRNTDGQS